MLPEGAIAPIGCQHADKILREIHGKRYHKQCAHRQGGIAQIGCEHVLGMQAERHRKRHAPAADRHELVRYNAFVRTIHAFAKAGLIIADCRVLICQTVGIRTTTKNAIRLRRSPPHLQRRPPERSSG